VNTERLVLFLFLQTQTVIEIEQCYYPVTPNRALHLAIPQ
jgi:hypothetical protein